MLFMDSVEHDLNDLIVLDQVMFLTIYGDAIARNVPDSAFFFKT